MWGVERRRLGAGAAACLLAASTAGCSTTVVQADRVEGSAPVDRVRLATERGIEYGEAADTIVLELPLEVRAPDDERFVVGACTVQPLAEDAGVLVVPRGSSVRMDDEPSVTIPPGQQRIVDARVTLPIDMLRTFGFERDTLATEGGRPAGVESVMIRIDEGLGTVREGSDVCYSFRDGDAQVFALRFLTAEPGGLALTAGALLLLALLAL